MTGVYFSLDIPAALHQQLKDYMSSASSSSGSSFSVKFNLLFSVYSIPNIILPFFGGTIVDHLGAHTSTLLFASLTLVGQIIFAVGTSRKSWNLMLFGRTVYGLGGESISVAISTLNNKWFRGKELALSFGITVAVSRLGSVANNWLSPLVANERGTDVAIWLGVGMNCMSVLMAAGICWLTFSVESGDGSGSGSGHYQLERSANQMLTEALLDHDDMRLEDELGQDEHAQQAIPLTDAEHEHTCEEAALQQDADSNEGSYDCDQSEASTVVTNNGTRLLDEAELASDACSPSSMSCISHISTFGSMFWLISMSCIVVYGCVQPFNNIASGILLERNYFTTRDSKMCHLRYEQQCSQGNLMTTANDAVDSDGNPCHLGSYAQPVLPTSIYIQASDENQDISSKWDNDSYHFDNLTENDVDCGDAFWKDSCTSNFCSAQKKATELSGRVMSIPYFLSALLSPFCGHIVDKIGLRAVIASLASVILVCVHLSLAWMDSSPVIPLIGQGFAYVCYAAVIWPSVPLTVKEESVGTAFGAIVAIQNIGLALFPLIIAAVYTASDNKYIPNVEYFFVVCAVLGTGVGIILNIVDGKTGRTLNNKSHQSA